jgi:hypothetical protein
MLAPVRGDLSGATSQHREDRAPLGVLEQHGDGGVERDAAEQQSDVAGGVLPRRAVSELVQPVTA